MQVRAARRLAQGRAKPVDLLAKELYSLAAGEQDGDDSSEEDSEEEEWGAGLERDGGGRSGPESRRRQRGGDALTQPYQVFQGLLLEDLRELHDDIKGFKVRLVLSP